MDVADGNCKDEPVLEGEVLTVEDVSRTEALADEATPAVKPPGSPELWPFLKLPRRQRAQFMQQVGPLMDKSESLSDLKELADDDGTVSAEEAADLFAMLADIEDVLRTTANDPAKFDRWAREAPDDQLMELLAWYMQTFQPGEAQASPS